MINLTFIYFQVRKPLQIFRHLKPLDEIYRNMLRFTPYPKHSIPNQTEIFPLYSALASPQMGDKSEIYRPQTSATSIFQPEQFSIKDCFYASSETSQSDPKKRLNVLNNNCPSLKLALGRLEKFKPVFNEEGLIRTPHYLNSTIKAQNYGTLSSPAPVPSVFPSKSYVRPDPNTPSFPDTSLDMSTVLTQTRDLLEDRLQNPRLFEYQSPDNDLTSCPKLGVVYFRVPNLFSFETLPSFHDESVGPQEVSDSSLLKLNNSQINVAENKTSGLDSNDPAGKENFKPKSSCSVKYRESYQNIKKICPARSRITTQNDGVKDVKCRPLGTYSMRSVRKQRSFSYLH